MDVTLTVVTLFSLALAATMTAVAWRLARDEQRRSAARVAALAAEITRDTDQVPMDLDLRAADATGPSVLPHPPTDRQRRRLVLGVGIGIAIAAAVAALAVPLGGGVATGVATSVSKPAAPVALPTLELIALDHFRTGNQLTVHGIVRNPGRTEIDHLTAVVVLFDRDGAELSTARAGMGRLAPAGEAPFSITVPDSGLVGRYRVSFRQGDTVVPQVDRRGLGT